MKKAVIEQFLLGFILVFASITFVATVGDEVSARNKAMNLKEIAYQTANTMSKAYSQSMNMCWSKNTAEEILKESKLGRELLELKANGEIEFNYDFYDFEDMDDDSTTLYDNQPDTIRVNITGYKHDNFWYKFLDKDTFDINIDTNAIAIDVPTTVTIRYGDRPNASFQNIFGTYQLDENDCITNVQMHMADSKAWNYWEQTDTEGNRIPIADGIQSPPTFVFAIANGYNHFNQPANNAAIDVLEDHCFNSTTYPKLKINNITKQATVGNAYTANVFFQHDELNADQFDHFHIIPKAIMDDYTYFKQNIYTSGNERDKYEAFKQYADLLNSDNDTTNDINYTTDPNNEYKYALEDLDENQSDMDFSDMLLDSTRLVIPNDTDNYTVEEETRKVIFDSDYCKEIIPPTLILEGCPVTTLEDTPTSDIKWTATDSDGTIESKQASTNNGMATINADGTITYTPDLNFYGTDVITVVVKDNDNAIAMKTCNVTIIEVNDPPTIEGTPSTIASVGLNYSFTPVAADVDGDVLTFSITNLPSWATFDTTTGTLSGTPATGDDAIYENIVISVNDGRGGVASIPVFSITVKDNNEAPLLNTPIPDQTIQEGEVYTYDISPHFQDPNGNPLTYAMSVTYNGAVVGDLNISESGVITSPIVPDGYAGRVFEITVTASDGSLSVSDTYNLTVTNNAPSWFHTFDYDEEQWSGTNAKVSQIKYNDEGVLRIKAQNRKSNSTYARQSFNFGPEYANKRLKIEFDMYHYGGWESSGSNQDYFAVARDYSIIFGWNSYGDGSNGPYGPEDITIESEKTDSDGRVSIQIALKVSDTNEVIYIDNFRISLQ